ncbi:MAG: ATPase, T2SS/T4P/T4SS family [Candidatus Thorarchaeota archaeon]
MASLRNVIDAYLVGPYISIFKTEGRSPEPVHMAFPILKTELEAELLAGLLRENERPELRAERMSLDQIIENSRNRIAELLCRQVPEISPRTRETIATVAALSRTALGQLFPLLLDENVEEVYIDGPMEPVYFDHSRLGRCLASCHVGPHDARRIVTLLRSESNLHADITNPSLKTDLSVCGTSYRFSVALPPLSPRGMVMEIRRPRSRAYDILDLIRNGTMTLDVAALLVLAYCSKLNITITGGPGSGKTTLLNALDMTAPTYWRRIYIEDSIESRLHHGGHQVSFRVDPVDESGGRLDKTSEIIKTLHRSPDYVILGEIQTADHSRALFQAISAGLGCIQTCHGHSAAGLITRWTNDHKIDGSSIALMDIVVAMERPRPGSSKRYVAEVAEIRRNIDKGIIGFGGLNVLYRRGGSFGPENLSPDGAVLQRALQCGVTSISSAFESVRHLLESRLDERSTLDPRQLGNILWSLGHPLMFDITKLNMWELK